MAEITGRANERVERGRNLPSGSEQKIDTGLASSGDIIDISKATSNLTDLAQDTVDFLRNRDQAARDAAIESVTQKPTEEKEAEPLIKTHPASLSQPQREAIRSIPKTGSTQLEVSPLNPNFNPNLPTEVHPAGYLSNEDKENNPNRYFLYTREYDNSLDESERFPDLIAAGYQNSAHYQQTNPVERLISEGKISVPENTVPAGMSQQELSKSTILPPNPSFNGPIDNELTRSIDDSMPPGYRNQFELEHRSPAQFALETLGRDTNIIPPGESAEKAKESEEKERSNKNNAKLENIPAAPLEPGKTKEEESDNNILPPPGWKSWDDFNKNATLAEKVRYEFWDEVRQVPAPGVSFLIADEDSLYQKVDELTEPVPPPGYRSWEEYKADKRNDAAGRIPSLGSEEQRTERELKRRGRSEADEKALAKQREAAGIKEQPFFPEDIDAFNKLDDIEKFKQIRIYEQEEAERVAIRRNQILRQARADWLADPANKGRDISEYPDIYKEDIEEFGDYTDPNSEDFRLIDEFENGRQRVAPNKIVEHRNRVISSLVRCFKRGWFRIEGGSYLDENYKIRYSPRVENSITNLMEDFNLHGARGQRTVFRLVMWYASLSNDRQTHMFLSDGTWGEWFLTEDEFVMICDCIERSCVLYGYPNAMPEQVKGKRERIRNTEVIPSGVLPKALARELVNPGSILNGGACPDGVIRWNIEDPVELIEKCQDQWVTVNYPYMKKNLAGEHMDQIIVIEDMQQAFYRMDGLSMDAFYDRFGIDTSIHYTLSEYEDWNLTYAAAAHGKWHSDEVAENNANMIAKYEKKAERQRGKIRRFGVDDTGKFHFGTKFEINGVPKQSNVIAGANLITNWIKFNNLVFRLPIIISAIPEAGLNVAFSSLSLKAIGGKQNISNATLEKVFSEEGLNSLDAMKVLWNIGGPGALRLFKETGQPMKHENVLNFLHNEYLAQRPELVVKANKFMAQLENAVLAGDRIFRNGDLKNWWNAYLIHNQLQINAMSRVEDGNAKYINSSHNTAYTIDEIEDAVAAHADISFFFAEAAGTDAGISAFAAMRGHNINQVNPPSVILQTWLSQHGISNFMITTFLDHFPTYGINFVMNMIPLSRTFSYISVRTAQKLGSETAGDMVMGGNLPAYWEGLKMNLFYDLTQIGRWGASGLFLGAFLILIGFDLPDDDQNNGNYSFYKIGSNLGWGPDTDNDGKGDGIEIDMAFFMNDLTQWGLPIGYGLAASYNFGPEIGANVLLDSLADSFDGNVMLDTVNLIKNWGDVLFDIEEITENPSYEGNSDQMSRAMYLFTDTLYNGIKYIDPTTAVSQMWENSSLLRGEMARRKDPSKVFDKSTPFRDAAGITKSVDTPNEYLARKNFKNSFLFATIANFTTGSGGDSDKTGYHWYEMPNVTHADARYLIWAEKYYMDYNNIPDGMTTEQYDHFMANMAFNDIKENWGHYDAENDKWTFDCHQAITDGYCLTSGVRDALANDIKRQQQQIMNEYYNASNSGAFSWSELQAYKNELWNKYNELKDFANNWVYNKDLPEFGVYYEQILTNFEPVYVYADTGEVAFAGRFAHLFDPNIEVIWKPKGDHPISIAPFTVTDYSDNGIDRGFSGESHPFYYQEGETGTDVDALREWGLDKIIPRGRDEGKLFSDVTFGRQLTGEFSHPDDPTVKRADVPVVHRVNEDTVGRETDSNINVTGNSTNAASNVVDSVLSTADNGSNSQTTTPSSTTTPDSGSNSAGNGNGSWVETPGSGSKNTLAGEVDTSSSDVPGASLTPELTDSKKEPIDGGVYGESAAFNQDAYDLFFGITKTPSGTSSGTVRKASSTYYGYGSKQYESLPKIYSNARTINNDRPSTMNATRPSNSNVTYLNPSFETKGSREAYKRQDF